MGYSLTLLTLSVSVINKPIPTECFVPISGSAGCGHHFVVGIQLSSSIAVLARWLHRCLSRRLGLSRGHRVEQNCTHCRRIRTRVGRPIYLRGVECCQHTHAVQGNGRRCSGVTHSVGLISGRGGDSRGLARFERGPRA